jgi:flagellar protein FliS
MRNPAHAYRQFSVQGASPLALVVMLYDGAITALRRAVTAIEAHDIQRKCDHLNRALAIILQLEGTLNFELGGEVAQTLQSLYMYSRGQIMKANVENSAPILLSLIEKISMVREAWYEADHRTSPSSPTSPGEAPPRPPSPAPPSGSWRMSA